MANFCSSDLRFLAQWSEITNLPIIEVDYSLFPAQYPIALQECLIAYKLLCEGKLGFNTRRIIIIGDSSGCNLAVSMLIKIIVFKLRLPDLLILSSPILNLSKQPTPSRLLFMMDPLVPMNLVTQCRKYYYSDTNIDDLLFVSPLISVTDDILNKFPPTNVVVGGLDPFLDDSIDFCHRLHNLNINTKLKIYKYSPHAFINFNYVLPNVNDAIHLIAQWINDIKKVKLI